MKRIRQLLFRIRELVSRRRIEAELAEEIRIHLEMATQENMRAGLPPGEARLAAGRQFGGVEQVKEAYRDERRLVGLDQIAGDVRHAVRSLLHARGFTVTVLFIVALCLAANVVIFSVVNGALLRPLPFPDPDRLVVVHDNYPKAGLRRTGVSVPAYLERKAGITAFAQAGAFRSAGFNLSTTNAQGSVEGAFATPSFFRVLGVDAALGRTFTEEEGVQGRDNVVLLSDGFWREHFSADPAVVGRSLLIENKPYTVVGVMPPGLRFLSDSPRLWRPLTFSDEDRQDDHRHGNMLAMIARLRPGTTLAQAQAQLEAVNEQARKVDPMAERVRSVGYFSTVSDLHADHVSDLRPALLLLQAGVVILLLIGAVNLANLFLVRATGRSREFSVRQALGAGRHQIVRALLVESSLLSLAGGLLGVGLGVASLRGMASFAASRLPSDLAPTVDLTVCLAALGISVLLGLLLAVPVIWIAAHGDLAASLAVESRGGTTTRSVHRLRHTLIVVQIALSFVLLSGAGLLGLSFIRVTQVDPGFHDDRLMTGAVDFPWWTRDTQPGQQMVVMERILSELRAIPGAASAAISNGVPFSGRVWVQAWSIAGGASTPDEFIKEGLYTDHVTGGYFATLGIPLVDGRPLNDDDVRLERPVCVVDEEFARRHWPHGGAIGSRLVLPYYPANTAREFFTIVGVVGSVKQEDLADTRAQGTAYFPMFGWSGFMVSVRTALAPQVAGPAIRAAVLRAEPGMAVYDVRPMDSRIDKSLSGRRTPLLLAAIFAGVSLVLAAVGIYGVLAYSVAQRRREIGVRMALGAQPSRILRQFLGLGAGLLSIGIPVGALGAWMAGRAVSGMLFDVTPANSLVLGGTAVVLVAAALPACLLPARRAASVAPNEALRSP